ncbi:hypothetical protein [Psychrobacillus sp. L3]|uniref:hypothetical protein n=1 Tax=Psychrobacillus sp. L3 TaxID=3236891 RepID=UPI0036F26984
MKLIFATKLAQEQILSATKLAQEQILSATKLAQEQILSATSNRRSKGSSLMFALLASVRFSGNQPVHGVKIYIITHSS